MYLLSRNGIFLVRFTAAGEPGGLQVYLGSISRGCSVLVVPFCGYRSIVSAIIVNSLPVKRCGPTAFAAVYARSQGIVLFLGWVSGPADTGKGQSEWRFCICLCIWWQLSLASQEISESMVSLLEQEDGAQADSGLEQCSGRMEAQWLP